VMTQEGWFDRVAEGWKAVAQNPKIVRVTGTHTSIIRGVVTDSGVDLADVRNLANILSRELARTPSKTDPVSSASRVGFWGSGYLPQARFIRIVGRRNESANYAP
jgi:hypothetical protein